MCYSENGMVHVLEQGYHKSSVSHRLSKLLDDVDGPAALPGRETTQKLATDRVNEHLSSRRSLLVPFS